MKTPYKIFIKNQIRLVFNHISHQWPFSLKEWIISVFLLSYLIGGLFFFSSIFRFIYCFPMIGQLLLDKLWHFYFFILWILLVFSNAIIQYTNQYRSLETRFLFCFPIKPHHIFFKQLFQGAIWSSWAFVFLSIPLLASFGFVLKSSALYYMGCILFLMPYIFLASAFGAILAWLSILLPRRSIGYIIFSIFLYFFVFILMNILKFPVELKGNADVQIIRFFNDFLNDFSFEQMLFMPNRWFSKGLISLAQYKIKDGLFSFAVLMTVSTVVVMFLKKFGSLIYPLFWKKAQSLYSLPKVSFVSIFIQKIGINELVKKDILTLLRDGNQIVQIVIILAIMMLYLVNLKNVNQYIDHPFWESIIFTTNICTIALMIATLSLRFVFPLFSFELKRKWLIGLIPINFKKILGLKFIFPFCSIFIISELINIVSCITLEFTISKIIFSAWVIFILNVGLVNLSLCLGVLYPRPKEDNPSKIISGIGGILNLVFAMTYILIVLIPISMPLHFKAMGKIPHALLYFSWIGSITFLETMLCLMVSLYLFKRTVQKEMYG